MQKGRSWEGLLTAAWSGCSCVDFVMERIAKGTTELMVASHNQNSVEQALSNMQRLNIRPHSPGTPPGSQQKCYNSDETSWH